MWRRCVLQLRQDLAHPCHVGGLPGLGALDHDDPRLLVLVLLACPLLDVCNLLWDELGYRLPVLLVGALVELLLVGEEKLIASSNTGREQKEMSGNHMLFRKSHREYAGS